MHTSVKPSTKEILTEHTARYRTTISSAGFPAESPQVDCKKKIQQRI